MRCINLIDFDLPEEDHDVHTFRVFSVSTKLSPSPRIESTVIRTPINYALVTIWFLVFAMLTRRYLVSTHDAIAQPSLMLPFYLEG